MNKKKVFKILSTLLVLFILTFISLEVYFRMSEKTEYGYLAPVMRSDDNLGFKFIPGGKFKSGNVFVNFNKYGYVGRDWNIDKDTSVYRIAVVGGCNLTGVFHIIDTAYYNFPGLAETELKQLGYNVEILNFGVPGESRSYYSFKTIEQDIVGFNPDLILLENLFPYTKKDYARDEYNGYQLEYLFTSKRSKEQAIKWADKLNKWKFIVYLIDHSWVIKKLALKYQHTHSDDYASFIKFAVKNQVSFIDDAVTGIYTMEKSARMTKELADDLQKKSIDLKILNYRAKPIKDTLISEGLEHVFLKVKFNKRFVYPKDNHFNNLGQLHLKDKFVEELIPIIPEKYHTK